MNTRIKFGFVIVCTAATSLFGCGGGGHHGGSGGGTTPPPVEPVNFNATVRALATKPESRDGAASQSPMDLNTPTWVFENDDETAFDDLFL